MSDCNRNPNTTCDQCQKPIYKRPWELEKYSNKFCSQKCYGLFSRETFPCPVCGKEIMRSENKKTCSRACSNKNRTGIKYGQGQSKDKYQKAEAIRRWLVEDRGSKCEVCEYPHTEALHAHHIKRRSEGGDNTLDNLLLLCPNCHYEVHHQLSTKAYLVDSNRRHVLGLQISK